LLLRPIALTSSLLAYFVPGAQKFYRGIWLGFSGSFDIVTFILSQHFYSTISHHLRIPLGSYE
jgi:hypothetical protein